MVMESGWMLGSVFVYFGGLARTRQCLASTHPSSASTLPCSARTRGQHARFIIPIPVKELISNAPHPFFLHKCKKHIENTYISFYTSSYENDFNYSSNILNSS